MARVKHEDRAPTNHIDDDVDMTTIPPQAHHDPQTVMPFRAPSAPISVASTPATIEPADTNGGPSTITPPLSNSDTDMGNAEDPGDGHFAMQTVCQGAHELIQAIQRLAELKIETTLPPLPKFVVIGDQSAGKSSLIEATCAISLPRSAGCCTRCPFQITTTAAKEGDPDWSCTVTLLVKYKPDDDAVAGEYGEEYNKWAKIDSMPSIDFAYVTSKQELEIVLRKAQLAILDPTTDPLVFRNLSEAEVERKQLQYQDSGFSPNVISLNITGTDLPEVSLFDLPGAINATPNDDDQHSVEFIEQLITAYIRDPGALILLTCAANQDIETSTAFRFVNKEGAKSRCMGVMTKPDLLDLDDSGVKRKELQNMLRKDAKHFRLGLGWFVAKQLSSKEMAAHVSYGEARRGEAEFFARGHWSGMLGPYADRFGIPNLQKNLSQVLTTSIIENLPEIFRRVQDKLMQVKSQLDSFPEQAAAPGLTVITEIGTLSAAIVKEIDPNSNTSLFRPEYQDVFRNLSQALLVSKPKIIFDTPGYVRKCITLDDSQEDEEMDPTPSKRAKANGGGPLGRMAAPATPSLSTPNRPTPGPSSGRSRKDPKQPQQSPAIQPPPRIVFKLDEVKERYDRAPSADMPGNASQHVDRELMLEPLRGWNAPVDDALTEIGRLFKDTLKQTVGRALATRKGTQFYSQALRFSTAFFKKLHEELTQYAYKMVAGHTRRPMTYATAVWKARLSGEKKTARTRRLEQRIDEYFDTQDDNGYKVPTKQDQRKKMADAAWLSSTLGADEYEREVEKLAGPIAYYEYAAQQLIDVLARVLEDGLMHEYEEGIHGHLLGELKAFDHDHCAWLLAENAEREELRKALQKERDKLEQALDELRRLPAVHA